MNNHFLNKFSDPADKARHDKRVSPVEQMLRWQERTPQTPQEQEIWIVEGKE